MKGENAGEDRAFLLEKLESGVREDGRDDAPTGIGDMMPSIPCTTDDDPFTPLGPSWLCQFSSTRDAGSDTGRARSRIESMKLYIAVFAPMPSASETTARR